MFHDLNFLNYATSRNKLIFLLFMNLLLILYHYKLMFHDFKSNIPIQSNVINYFFVHIYNETLDWNIRRTFRACQRLDKPLLFARCHYCTDKTIFPFPFLLNGIWSWWQFSFRFRTKWKSIWFKIERKTVIRIISHSMWKELEI